MRFMMLAKASKDSEAGKLPSRELLAAMGQFNEAMAKAGVLLAAEGLQPSSKGTRVTFTGGKRLMSDGPFAETKELLAGFWTIQVKSKAERSSGPPASPSRVVKWSRCARCSRRRTSRRRSSLPRPPHARKRSARSSEGRPASRRNQVRRWNGTSTTTTPRRNRSAPFTRSAVWLCSRCCHHRRGTNSGMTIVTTEFGSCSRMRPT